MSCRVCQKAYKEGCSSVVCPNRKTVTASPPVQQDWPFPAVDGSDSVPITSNDPCPSCGGDQYFSEHCDECGYDANESGGPDFEF